MQPRDLCSSRSLSELSGPLIDSIRRPLETLRAAIEHDRGLPAEKAPPLGAYDAVLALVPVAERVPLRRGPWELHANLPKRGPWLDGPGPAGNAGMSACLVEGKFQRLWSAVASGQTADAKLAFGTLLGTVERLQRDLARAR